MKLSTLLTTLTFAPSALSAPQHGLHSRIAARSAQRTLNHQSQPLAALSPPGNERTSTNIAYSSNWAGVVREQPPPSASYTSVAATFTVPAPKPASTGGLQAASAWVGIDGDTYTTAILQAGVDFYWENGQIYNSAWFEWFPDVAHDFDLVINTGDVVSVSVQSFTATSGVAIIVNESTGKSASKQIKAPNGQAKLAGQNADWIVEDFQSGSQIVPFVDFGEVVFSGMKAEGGMKSYGADGGTVIELQQNGRVLTEVQVLGGEGMRVRYVA